MPPCITVRIYMKVGCKEIKQWKSKPLSFFYILQMRGSEDRRRTLTPLALRERYNALNEPAMGMIRLWLQQFPCAFWIKKEWEFLLTKWPDTPPAGSGFEKFKKCWSFSPALSLCSINECHGEDGVEDGCYSRTARTELGGWGNPETNLFLVIVYMIEWHHAAKPNKPTTFCLIAGIHNLFTEMTLFLTFSLKHFMLFFKNKNNMKFLFWLFSSPFLNRIGTWTSA